MAAGSFLLVDHTFIDFVGELLLAAYVCDNETGYDEDDVLRCGNTMI